MERACKLCGTSFEARTKRAQYCSIKCKTQYSNNKRSADTYNAYMRQWRRDNLKHVQEQDRNRYQQNPTPKRESSKRYSKWRYHTDPSYRSLKLSGRFGDIDIMIVYQRDGYICRYCSDTDGPFHIDHMTPLSRGGQNTLENLTVACANCNLRKHSMTAEEFLNVGVC